MSSSTDTGPSIRRRLLLFLLPSLTVVVLAWVFTSYRAQTVLVREAYDRRLGDVALALAANFHPAAADGTGAATSPASISLLGPLQFAIRDAEGHLLQGNARLPEAKPGGANPAYHTALIDGEEFRIATYRIGHALRAATVSVAESTGSRDSTNRFLLIGSWGAAFIEVDVTLLLVVLAVEFGLRPLFAVRRQIENRSAHNLLPLEIRAAPAEVQPLVDALNMLFVMLAEATNSQRRFVADTAHQLRTPLTGILGQLELLQHDPAAAGVRGALAQIQQGITRLAHSANQLLALARTDPTVSRSSRFEVLDLSTIVAGIVNTNLERASRKGLDLGALTSCAGVLGDPRLLEDLLGNLVDNALTYTPPGGHVTVRCGVGRDGSFVEVEDDGPGIPQSERAHVRQRFYRIPGTQGHGCGLGLAIVDEIVRLHEADLSIADGPGGHGARIRVQFPGAAPGSFEPACDAVTSESETCASV
jgi:two-component system, OmpR family, sensor histidine kinase TctE